MGSKAEGGDDGVRAFTNLFEKTPLAAVLRDLSIVAVDAGARGGVDSDLLPIAFAVDVLGFEPDPQAFARLSSSNRLSEGWKSVRYLPAALAGASGQRTLHVPTDPEGASLLKPDPAIGTRFDKLQFFTGIREVPVDCVTLDAAIASASVGAPAYLKLDVEGAELEVLAVAPRTLGSLVAVKTEVSFLPFRHGQALAGDVDAFLRARGFQPMDFLELSRWRRYGYVLHPHADGQPIPYSRGQIAHGDALYFRDPATVSDDDDAGRRRLLTIAAIALSFGFFDFAATILQRPRLAAELSERYKIDTGRVLAGASRLYGRVVWRRAFWRHVRGVVTYLRSAARLYP
jgi:FkbM family methyltransferase